MSVLYDRQGPDWPLGFIQVVTPGTPVSIMSLVDPSGLADPATVTAAGVPEYTVRCQQLMFAGMQPDTHGLKNNTKNVYVVRKGGSRDDPGAIVAVVPPGAIVFLASAPSVTDVWNPYRYWIDADVGNEGALVTLLIF